MRMKGEQAFDGKFKMLVLQTICSDPFLVHVFPKNYVSRELSNLSIL